MKKITIIGIILAFLGGSLVFADDSKEKKEVPKIESENPTKEAEAGKPSDEEEEDIFEDADNEAQDEEADELEDSV